MIDRWNDVVQRGDEVFILGDFSWRSPAETKHIRYKLKGALHFIAGNHDTSARKIKKIFSSFQEYRELKINHQKIVLFHYPIQEWNGKNNGWWHLHGHSHGRCDSTGILRYDVGVDSNEFMPVSERKIFEIMQRKKKEIEEKLP